MNYEKYDEFEKDLTKLINKYSLENGSNTPDFLARHLVGCLVAFNSTSNQRLAWFKE